MEVFEIIQPGSLTSVQDLGRRGYQRYGVPVAGAMDGFAFCIANELAGNAENEAGLEITLLGPRIRLLGDVLVAVTGGDFAPKVNNSPLKTWESVAVKKDDIISFGWVKRGCRAYLAVSGGIDVPVVMGSRSTYMKSGIGGLEGRPLKAGDRLKCYVSPRTPAERKLPPGFIPDYSGIISLRVVLGPQDDYFTDEGVQLFLDSEYTVSGEADRTGYRLDGPAIKHRAGADIISDGIPLGAVQVPGNGRPIVLLADRQTTGGYPKIATVVSADIPRLAQAKPGDKVRFKNVTVAEARNLFLIYEKTLAGLKKMIKQGN